MARADVTVDAAKRSMELDQNNGNAMVMLLRHIFRIKICLHYFRVKIAV
jgi:hypothetical protein